MPLNPGERVCAVVVTFNRRRLLGECLDSLLAQTRPVDQIVIVENASTDGTQAFLASQYPQLTVLHLPENAGGAGGFHAGMKWAVDAGFDWVWVMDDDVRVKRDALHVMLGYGSVGDMIHARKRINGDLLVWESIWDAQACATITYETDISFENGRDWVQVAYGCFEGALIRGALIERAGLPDPRYFLAGDDTVYGYIASLHGRVIYIRYEGLEKEGTPGRFGRLYYYAVLRNRFLTFETFRIHGLLINRKLFLMHQIYALFQLWARILRDPQSRTWTIFRAPLEGLVHGFQGRFGKPYWIR